MSNQRRKEVQRIIELKGEALLIELQENFPNVSSMTLRRDLIKLEEDGLIKRTRGGAVAINRIAGGLEGVYSQRAMEQVQAKLAIAQKALQYVGKGHSLYFDSGSTIMYLAKSLPDYHFPVITSGANIAMELLKNPKCMVTLLGGQLNANTLSVSGALAMQYIQTVNIDIAIMAASGFSVETGFTSGSHTENELKREVIKKSRKTIMLMDSSKIDKAMPLTFAHLDDIDVLVMDEEPSERLRQECRKFEVEIAVASI